DGCGPGSPAGSASRIMVRPLSARDCGAAPRPGRSCASCGRPSMKAASPRPHRDPGENQRRNGRLPTTGENEGTAVEAAYRDDMFDMTGPVATLVLTRPGKLNAVTPQMTDAIRGYADRINSGGEVRAVVLAGAGDRAFCAGSDIGELDAYDTAWEFRGRPDYCDAVRSIRKPVIAAVNGYAYGGGLELAMSADIRLASRNAAFAAPEIKLGWIGGGGVSTFLAHSAGPSHAALMLYTGDPGH